LSNDLERHTIFCARRRARVHLLNASRLLDVTNRTYRPLTYGGKLEDLKVEASSTQGTEIVTLKFAAESDGHVHKLPNYVSEQPRLSLLVYNQQCCRQAFNVYFELIQEAFQGMQPFRSCDVYTSRSSMYQRLLELCHFIGELYVTLWAGLPYEARKEPSEVRVDGHTVLENPSHVRVNGHAVVLLLTEAQELWILDLTCYQYGLDEVLLPLTKFISKHDTAFLHLVPLGNMRRAVMEWYLPNLEKTFPASLALLRVWLKPDLLRVFRDNLLLLRLTDQPAQFDQALTRYMQELEAAFSPLASHIEKHYHIFKVAVEGFMRKTVDERRQFVRDLDDGEIELLPSMKNTSPRSSWEVM
jgi:hypothetical protein